MQKTETFTGIDGINAQDRAVQESMGPIVDRTREHLGPADRAVIQARRLLLQATRTVEAGGTPPGVEPTYYTLHPAEAVVPAGTDWRTLLAPDAPRPQICSRCSRADMRALVLEKFNGPFVAKDVPMPAIAPHETLVRVRNVGVCGTDVKIRADRMGLGVIPLIMGHEIAGEVAEVGRDVRGVAPGDRVVVNFYITCGRCPTAASDATPSARRSASTASASTAASRST